MGEVLQLFTCLVHRFPMQQVSEIEVLKDKGFKGCIHGRPGSKRQVSLIDCETLEKFGLAPGVVKENITTQGIDFQSLATGNVLRIGDCVLEITGPCEPCARMDEIRMGLQEQLRGQRGWLCRVTQAGKIRKGDRIDVLVQAAVNVATNDMEARPTR
ncbi:MAG: MOSC domain-containing protein [Candidatus Acidiferrales bacterium]|jgi:MOSC domain-containing protein YiiM